MKYAVIYQSKSGNTERIARTIYGAIDADEKGLYDIDSNGEVPTADFSPSRKTLPPDIRSARMRRDS